MAYVIINGDALTVLRSMGDESVHVCCTSPPYWGLRDYKLEPLVWRGKRECNLTEHIWGSPIPGSNRGGSGTPTDKNNRGEGYGRDAERGTICLQCGAWRGSLGLEPTPELYVQHLTEIFREVRRVLRADGTLWLNLGDSYCANGSNQVPQTKQHIGSGFAGPNRNPLPGLKPKDLIGIPWRVAFALQADGWWLRSDIIWHKPNPMPESVTDRPTKAHEYVFLLAKSQKYYYDAEAIKEPIVSNKGNARSFRGGGSYTGGNAYINDATKERETHGNEPNQNGTRNRRSVWTIATKPYREAHFATFPPALVEPIILAGCPPGGVVLDPFAGAGTTLLVAEQLGRDSIGIEPSPDYCRMAKGRIKKGK